MNYSLVADYTNPANPYEAGSTVPRISGEVKVGGELTVADPTITVGGIVTTATLSYKWYRAGVLIPGAIGKDYMPVAADLGKGISVIVTLSRPASCRSPRPVHAPNWCEERRCWDGMTTPMPRSRSRVCS